MVEDWKSIQTIVKHFNIKYFLIKIEHEVVLITYFVFSPTEAPATRRSKNGYVFQEMGA